MNLTLNAPASPRDLELWEEAPEIFKSRTFDFGNFRTRVQVDWHPVLDFIEMWAEKPDGLISGNEANVAVPFSVFSEELNPEPRGVIRDMKRRAFATSSSIELYMLDMHMILNLAKPSSFAIRNAILDDPPSPAPYLRIRSIYDEGIPRNDPSAFQFDIDAVALPLQRVFDWYSKLDPRLSLRTSKIRGEHAFDSVQRMRKAIYALFFCTRSHGYDPASIVWLSHGLESLFGIGQKKGKAKEIRRRASSLHSIPNHKDFGEHLSEFYKFRSSFVHGDYQTPHPIGVPLLWEFGRSHELDEEKRQASDFISSYFFGFHLLFSSIRETISRGWASPYFIEPPIQVKGAQFDHSETRME